jgi:hypothetical protein
MTMDVKAVLKAATLASAVSLVGPATASTPRGPGELVKPTIRRPAGGLIAKASETPPKPKPPKASTSKAGQPKPKPKNEDKMYRKAPKTGKPNSATPR